MLKLERPVVFLDFETTGTDSQKDRIVELAAVKLFPDFKREVKRYLINPEMVISEGASKIHGITNEMVKDAETFAVIGPRLLVYITDCDLAGFKSNTFDFPMLYAECLRVGLNWDYTKHSMVDVGNIFIIQEPRTLSAAVKYYCGKELEGAHGAEADIMGTVDVFEEQLKKYPDLPNTIEELALFSDYGKKKLDMAGKFVYAEDGITVLLNCGKEKGQPAHHHYGFLQWMLGKDFPPDTKDLARKIISEIPVQ